jgi:NAD(P)-dependent dehydrogenase (short-subunit alcohol dehydrogenase family)|tara:strand:+ start:216 stop:1019 length:804 start_codon:yes stop_codon:yes gene_type:complete
MIKNQSILGYKMERLKNKIALITGAAQGIGLATAKLFVQEGAKVLLTDINIDKANSESKSLNKIYPDQTLALDHDVTSKKDWQYAIEFIENKFGGINILVNNAGIGSLGNVENESFEKWKQVHSVDLDSVFLGCKYAIPIIKKSKSGSIINVSSISGIIASHNMAAYNSAKSGVRHLSKSIALHCARDRNNIRCNSIHPAFIDTPILDDLFKKIGHEAAVKKLSRQIPMGQIGEPNDVAYGILYLASDESKFMTGAEIIIDGGISAA